MIDLPESLRLEVGSHIPSQTIHCAAELYLFLNHHLSPLGYEIVIDDSLTAERLKVSQDVYEGVSPAYLSESVC